MKGKNAMNEKTKQTIETILTMDPSITSEESTAIKRVLCNRVQKRELINARQACEILGVTRRTLRIWEIKGRVKGIRHSLRQIRFDKNEIERLAYCGMDSLDK
jgi:hypothetical protein